MDYFPELKFTTGDIEIEYQYELYEEKQNLKVEDLQFDIQLKKQQVGKKIYENNSKLDELNKDIDKLTNHSDGLDYMVAAGSGIIVAMIDSFWVGGFSLDRASDWGSEKTDEFVKKIAQSQGYEGDDLVGAIRSLENKFSIASDSNTPDFGGGLQHHLRDFAHHPTIVGLMFSLLTQFTKKSYGTDTAGNFLIVDVRNTKMIGEDLPQKLLFGVVFWFFHMVSDMAGSSNSPGEGTGLPGPLLSLVKELSVLPIIKKLKIGDTELSAWIAKLFNGTLLGEVDENGKKISFRFDLRAEIGVAYELGRQAIPVIINECVVRGFYFIRRFMAQLKEKNINSFKELKLIELEKVLPFKNRTVVRMLTISTATFTAIDLGDAAIRSVIKSTGNSALFIKEFYLKVNYVGLGRFAIAIRTDTFMEINKNQKKNEKIKLLSEQLHYLNISVYYTQAAMWIKAENAEKTINDALNHMEKTTRFYIDNYIENKKSLRNIGEFKQKIERTNPRLIEEILDSIRWGYTHEKSD